MPYAEFFANCKSIGISEDNIKNLYELTKTKRVKNTGISAEKMIEICNCDKKIIDICTDYKISVKQYYEIRGRCKIVPLHIKTKVEDLTEEEIEFIRNDDSLSIKEMLEKFNISLVSYYRIKPNVERKKRVKS